MYFHNMASHNGSNQSGSDSGLGLSSDSSSANPASASVDQTNRISRAPIDGQSNSKGNQQGGFENNRDICATNATIETDKNSQCANLTKIDTLDIEQTGSNIQLDRTNSSTSAIVYLESIDKQQLERKQDFGQQNCKQHKQQHQLGSSVSQNTRQNDVSADESSDRGHINRVSEEPAASKNQPQVLLKSLLKKTGPSTDAPSASASSSATSQIPSRRAKTVTFNQTVIVFCEEIDALSMPVAFHANDMDVDDQDEMQFDLPDEYKSATLDLDQQTSTGKRPINDRSLYLADPDTRNCSVPMNGQLLGHLLGSLTDANLVDFDEADDVNFSDDEIPAKFLNSSEAFMCSEAISDCDYDSESSLALFELKQRGSIRSTVDPVPNPKDSKSRKASQPKIVSQEKKKPTNLVKPAPARVKVSTLDDRSSMVQGVDSRHSMPFVSRRDEMETTKTRLEGSQAASSNQLQKTAATNGNSHKFNHANHTNTNNNLVHDQVQANQVDPLQLPKTSTKSYINTPMENLNGKMTGNLISRSASELVKISPNTKTYGKTIALSYQPNNLVKATEDIYSESHNSSYPSTDLKNKPQKNPPIFPNPNVSDIGQENMRNHERIGTLLQPKSQSASCHICRSIQETSNRTGTSKASGIVGASSSVCNQSQSRSSTSPPVHEQAVSSSCSSCLDAFLRSSQSARGLLQNGNSQSAATPMTSAISATNTAPRSETPITRPVAAYQLVYAIDPNGNRIRALSLIGTAAGQNLPAGLNRLVYQGRNIIIARPAAGIRFPNPTNVANITQTQGNISRDTSTNSLVGQCQAANALFAAAGSTPSQTLNTQSMSNNLLFAANPGNMKTLSAIRCVPVGDPTQLQQASRTQPTSVCQPTAVYYLRQPLNSLAVRQALFGPATRDATSRSSFPEPHQIRLLDGLKTPPDSLQLGQTLSKFNETQSLFRGQMSKTLEDLEDPSFGFSKRPSVKVVSPNHGGISQSRSDVTMGATNEQSSMSRSK